MAVSITHTRAHGATFSFLRELHCNSHPLQTCRPQSKVCFSRPLSGESRKSAYISQPCALAATIAASAAVLAGSRRFRWLAACRRLALETEGIETDAGEDSYEDTEYRDAPTFESYEDLGIHREMLEDEPRTEAFRQAIFQTCAEKVVLDVGCGTGILSIFAAQAGATRVVAVEASEYIAACARALVQHNGFEDRVCVITGRIEEVAEQVDAELCRDDCLGADVLVSEWMGFMLVCEGMFESVAFARDRWLTRGGLMIPSNCTVWAAPFSCPALVDKMTCFWKKGAYGVDLSSLGLTALNQFISQPVIEVAEYVLAKPMALWEFDCRDTRGAAPTAQSVHFDFQINYSTASEQELLGFRPDDETVLQDAHFHGLAVWFTCELAPGILLSTSPTQKPTHWSQTLLFMEPVSILRGWQVRMGDKVRGVLRWIVIREALELCLEGEVEFMDGRTPGKVAFKRDLELEVH